MMMNPPSEINEAWREQALDEAREARANAHLWVGDDDCDDDEFADFVWGGAAEAQRAQLESAKGEGGVMIEGELPREKLMRLGREAMSDDELIAIFLRTGMHGCNAHELASRLKQEAGSLSKLGQFDAGELALLCGGIGAAKAASLVAAFELGLRALREQVSQQALKSAHDVYELLAPQVHVLEQESMFALLLNSKRGLIRCVSLAKGTSNRVVVHPRDVFRLAIRYNANGIVLAHNHPSGDPTPSKADHTFTERIVNVGALLNIPLRDHIIIGKPGCAHPTPYFSFEESRCMPSPQPLD